MRRTSSKWLIVAVGASVALLGLELGLELRYTQQLRAYQLEVLDSHERVAAVDRVLSLVKDAEAAQRGYLLSGDLDELHAFNTAVAALDARLADISKRIGAGDATQQRQLDSLSLTAHDKLRELGQSLGAIERLPGPAERTVIAGKPDRVPMDSLRSATAAMTDAERGRLQARFERTKSYYHLGQWGAVANAVFIFLTMGALGLLVRRQRATASSAAQQAEHLRVTLSSIGDAVVTTDPTGRVTHLNPMAESLTGWSHAEAHGQALEAVFNVASEGLAPAGESATSAATSASPGEATAQSGPASDADRLLRSRDGREHPIAANAAPIRAANGELLGKVVVFRDVSARRKVDQAAAERQRELRLVADTVPVLIAHVDADRRYRFVSRPYAALLSSSPAQLVGKRMPEVMSAAMYAAVSKHIDTVLQGRPVEFELEHFVPRFGSKRWFHASYAPEHDAAGRVVGFVAATVDITARKEAERQAREGDLRLHLAMEAADMGHWQLNLTSGEFAFSADSYRLFGLDSDTPLDKRLFNSLIHPDDRQRNSDAVAHALRHGRYAIDLRIVKPGSNLVTWLSLRGRVFKDADDGGARLVGVLSDITDRETMQQSLREADHRKDEFLATLAHELRNPLAPIGNGLATLARAGDKTQALQQLLPMMQRQLSHLVQLVDDLLDVSRIGKGKLQLRRGRVELQSVLHRTVEACRVRIEAAAHRFELDLPEAPIYLDADPVRLAQVFGNLLDNACKYTHSGGQLALRLRREANTAVVRVSDNGVGIPSDRLSNIFEMFAQVDPSLERSTGGLGIGLALVQRLVGLHGGEVQAHSAGPGRGAEFVVRLPLDPALQQQRATSHDAPLPAAEVLLGPQCILVVDDNRDSAESMASLLALTGHETHTAADGPAAIEATARLDPDIVLLDIGLPGLSGFQVCEHIRAKLERPAPQRKRVVVALTGWGQDHDRKRSKAAGFDAHFVKPVDYAELMHLLANLLGAPQRIADSGA